MRTASTRTSVPGQPATPANSGDDVDGADQLTVAATSPEVRSRAGADVLRALTAHQQDPFAAATFDLSEEQLREIAEIATSAAWGVFTIATELARPAQVAARPATPAGAAPAAGPSRGPRHRAPHGRRARAATAG